MSPLVATYIKIDLKNFNKNLSKQDRYICQGFRLHFIGKIFNNHKKFTHF